jgi:hypothetical protein
VARLEFLLAEKYRQLERLSELEQARAQQLQQRLEQTQQQQRAALVERGQLPVAANNQKHSQAIVGGNGGIVHVVEISFYALR